VTVTPFVSCSRYQPSRRRRGPPTGWAPLRQRGALLQVVDRARPVVLSYATHELEGQ